MERCMPRNAKEIKKPLWHNMINFHIYSLNFKFQVYF